jgi:hypothetical protein
MNETDILSKVAALVAREHELRELRAAGLLDEGSEHEQLRVAEVELDQCWDLLRQRRAKREYGSNPDEASPRTTSVVEGYWQ